VSANPHALLLDRGNLRRRRRINRATEIAATIAALVAVAVLALVVGSVVAKGIGSINIDFLTKSTAGFGETSGGIANAIVGSAIAVGIGAAMAVPVGILIAIYTTEFAEQRIASIVRFALDVLNGVPTIVTAVFVLGIATLSGFAVSIALAIIMLPIVARTSQEVLELVPETLREGSYALGVTRWRTVLRVTLPTAFGGLLTGSLLAVARAAGETAPWILLSYIFPFGQVITDPSQQMPSLPLFIFQQSEAPSPAAHDQAWAAALVLIALVLILNIVARTFYARSRSRLEG
jgi:phosphate transport system permease protein